MPEIRLNILHFCRIIEANQHLFIYLFIYLLIYLFTYLWNLNYRVLIKISTSSQNKFNVLLFPIYCRFRIRIDDKGRTLTKLQNSMLLAIRQFVSGLAMVHWCSIYLK